MEQVVEGKVKHGVDLIAPAPRDPSWQARTEGGFDISHFAVDWESESVTCQGKTSRVWKPTHDWHGNDVVTVAFAKKECLACPSRSVCIRSKVEQDARDHCAPVKLTRRIRQQITCHPERRERGGRYYTRSRKVEGRVIREYVGPEGSPLAELAAEMDHVERLEREEEAAVQRKERERLDALHAPVEELCEVAEVLARAALLTAGYHRHKRGEWRKPREP